MALVLADRVRETTAITGTGTATLLGAVSGYQSFSAVGNANTTYYVIANQSASEWEVGIGTYTASGTTLSRDTVLSSSNSGSLVNFSAGTKDVFVDYPAGRAVYEDAAGNVDGYPITGGTINNTTIGATTPSTGVFTTLTATGQTSLGGVAGSEGLRVNSVAGSTNWLDVTGSNSNRVDVTALGPAGSNVALRLSSRGTEPVKFYTKAQTLEQFRISNTDSAVNYVQVTGAATGASPTISAQGSDASAGLVLLSKSASIIFQTRTAQGRSFNVLDTGAPVNYLQVQGSTTGNQPFLTAQGTDTNISLGTSSKGTGSVSLYTNGGGQLQFTAAHTASAVNYVQVTGAATGNDPTYSAQGSDSNVSLRYLSKGAGEQ
jgi:hypothetical protein